MLLKWSCPLSVPVVEKAAEERDEGLVLNISGRYWHRHLTRTTIQVKLSDVECGSLSLYVGQVAETSKVEVGERGARVVVSATTIEREGGLDCKEGCGRQCRSDPLVAACACLPWQLNHPVQAPTCVGDLQISCSSQVKSKKLYG